MGLVCWTYEYIDGVDTLLDFIFSKSSNRDEIVYPCMNSNNILWQSREIVHEHLIVEGLKKVIWVIVIC